MRESKKRDISNRSGGKNANSLETDTAKVRFKLTRMAQNRPALNLIKPPLFPDKYSRFCERDGPSVRVSIFPSVHRTELFLT